MTIDIELPFCLANATASSPGAPLDAKLEVFLSLCAHLGVEFC